MSETQIRTSVPEAIKGRLLFQRQGNVAACSCSLALSFLLFQLTPPLLPGAFQSFHVIPPLQHLSHHLTGECICSTSQISCHIYFKHSFRESEFTFADGKNFSSEAGFDSSVGFVFNHMHLGSFYFHLFP